MLTQSLKAQNAWKCLILEVHMLQDIMYVVFFFFTHKQSYSGNHFTGGSNTVGIVIKIISVLNMILEIAYLIRFAIRISILHAIILFVTAIVITLFVNGLICKQTISRVRKKLDINNSMFVGVYNRECDVTTTKIALVGIIVNLIIIIVYIV
jgi:hypothetical protein